MRTIGGLVLAVALVATGLALWSSSNTLAKQTDSGAQVSTPVRSISAREIHGKVNIKNLPTRGNDEDAI